MGRAKDHNLSAIFPMELAMFKKILVPVDVDYPETAAAVYNKAADTCQNKQR
jgi:hypothetical protein